MRAGPLRTLARLAFVAAHVTQGPGSFLTYLRLSRMQRRNGPRAGTMRIRLKPLGGRELFVRPGTSDVDMIWETFGPGHRPPPEAEGADPRLIWDLGANIGLTMADLAHRHPRARVVGLEMDAENAAVGRRNLSAWGDRCELIEAAAWPRDGELRYHRFPAATSDHRVADAPHDAGAPLAVTDALSPFSLLALEGPGAEVDYARVAVEGAEAELLRVNAGWTGRVRAMSVAVHPPYTAAACQEDLRGLGFDTRPDPGDRQCVIAVRTS